MRSNKFRAGLLWKCHVNKAKPESTVIYLQILLNVHHLFLRSQLKEFARNIRTYLVISGSGDHRLYPHDLYPHDVITMLGEILCRSPIRLKGLNYSSLFTQIRRQI